MFSAKLSDEVQKLSHSGAEHDAVNTNSCVCDVLQTVNECNHSRLIKDEV